MPPESKFYLLRAYRITIFALVTFALAVNLFLPTWFISTSAFIAMTMFGIDIWHSCTRRYGDRRYLYG